MKNIQNTNLGENVLMASSVPRMIRILFKKFEKSV